jgi:hypothetical protein
MFDDKRGQVFFSYLENYRWLFIFEMIEVFLIFSMGLFSFGLIGNNKCSFESPDFVCKDVYANENKVSFVVQNRRVNYADLVSASVFAKNNNLFREFSDPMQLSRGESKKIEIEYEDLPRIVRGDLEIKYLNPKSGLTFHQKGDIKFKT